MGRVPRNASREPIRRATRRMLTHQQIGTRLSDFTRVERRVCASRSRFISINVTESSVQAPGWWLSAMPWPRWKIEQTLWKGSGSGVQTPGLQCLTTTRHLDRLKTE